MGRLVSQRGDKMVEMVVLSEKLREFVRQVGMAVDQFLAFGRLPGVQRLEVRAQD
jgi:hypothetical protein